MSEVTGKYKEKERGTTAGTTRNLFRLTITNAKNNMQIMQNRHTEEEDVCLCLCRSSVFQCVPRCKSNSL